MTDLWISRFDDYWTSGETVEAWCKRRQVMPKQFYYWMAKLEKSEQQTPPASGPRWVAVSVEEAKPAEAPPILVRVGVAAIEVRAGFEPAVLAGVVRTLKALC